MASAHSLSFENNQSFTLVWDMSLWAVLYDLTIGKFRMQARVPDDGSFNFLNVLYQWTSYGANSGGTIIYEPVSQLLIIQAQYADMIKLPAGAFAYDLQYQIDLPTAGNPRVIDMDSGMLTITNGVSRF